MLFDNLKNNNLFPYYIGKKPGLIIPWLFYLFCKRAKTNPELKDRIRLMQSKGVVVYAVKYRGILDFLLLHFNFHVKRIPYPRVAWDIDLSMFLPVMKFLKISLSRLKYLIKYRKLPDPYELGFYKDIVGNRIPSMIFLVDPKGFINRFFHLAKSPIQYLIEIQRKIEHPIFIVPQVVLYRKEPEKEKSGLWSAIFRYQDRIGLLKKLLLFFKNPRDIYIDTAPPINLKEYLQFHEQNVTDEQVTEELKNKLIKAMDEQKRIIIGPIMKSRHQIMEKVLMSNEFLQRLDKMSGGNPKKLKQLKKKAKEYFNEIAADYNTSYIEVFDYLLDWLLKRLFDDIEANREEISRIRDWARRGPLIYVPSHKSHMDYLILNHILYKHHMHTPRIAAGQNLTFWPMGPIFRRLGAFFIRRSFRFRGAKLYSEVFTRYIKVLIQEGYPIEFFIEGGRSRNGKLVLPKTGFLSILIQAYREGHCNDLVFVPASIVYDRIMEEKSYIQEIEGQEKKKETFMGMLKARRLLKRRYGKAYIRFSEPISLKDYLESTDNGKSDISRKLAFHLVKAINDVTTITPLNLTATSILTNHRKGFYLSWVMNTTKILHEFLKYRGTPFTGSFNEISAAVEETMSLLIDWKIVERIDQEDTDEEPFFFVEDEKKLELDFYKNCIIHYFISQSFLALSLLRPKDQRLSFHSILDNYMFLRRIFRNEFILENNINPLDEIRASLSYFLNKNYIVEENDFYTITRNGVENLTLWGKIVKNYLESYWIVVQVLSNEKVLEKKRILQRIRNTAKRFYKMGIIEHLEAISQLNFQNALDVFREEFQKIKESPQEDSISQIGKTLYEFIVPGHQDLESSILFLPTPSGDQTK